MSNTWAWAKREDPFQVAQYAQSVQQFCVRQAAGSEGASLRRCRDC